MFKESVIVKVGPPASARLMGLQLHFQQLWPPNVSRPNWKDHDSLRYLFHQKKKMSEIALEFIG